MRELQPGLWTWEAPHPDWTPEQGREYGWGPAVTSYALDDGERLLLFDPIAPPSLVDELAAGRHPVVLLTCPWHARDTAAAVDRLGAEVWVPRQGEDASEHVDGHAFVDGDRLPGGITAYAGTEPSDLVLWVESRRALVTGDTLIDRGRGLELPADWAGEAGSVEETRRALRPLLELPVELVLPTHGQPTDRAALERALG